MSATNTEAKPQSLSMEELILRARAMAPAVRARATEAERLRRQPDETIAEAAESGLLALMTPKVYGGHGFGIDALTAVCREIARGDASAAWTIGFLIEHNWMAARFPKQAQQEAFANGNYFLASAPLHAQGRAVRVPGGFKASATWRYGSGTGNSDWAFVTSPVEEDGEDVAYSFLLPLSDVTINDDWFMSGMAATSSCSITGEDVFIPEHRALRTELFHSADRHPGADHVEAVYRYPLGLPLTNMMGAIALGVAEACVEEVRARLATAKVMGKTPRLHMPQSRVRWGIGLQKVRCAELLLERALEVTVAKGDAQLDWSAEEEGQFLLDCTTAVHLCKEAVELLCDGVGSAPYRLSDPLQRFRRDIVVIANHMGFDFDVEFEHSTRLILGLGDAEHDFAFSEHKLKSESSN